MPKREKCDKMVLVDSQGINEVIESPNSPIYARVSQIALRRIQINQFQNFSRKSK